MDITAWDKDAGKRDDFIGRFVQTTVSFTLEMAGFVERMFSLNLVVVNDVYSVIFFFFG